MMATCPVYVNFFAVLAVILIAHYSGMASSGKNVRYDSALVDSFGRCLEKAAD